MVYIRRLDLGSLPCQKVMCTVLHLVYIQGFYMYILTNIFRNCIHG